MHLKVLLPFAVFIDTDDVTHIVVETRAGALGLLPRRLDCAAALAPGILSYTSASKGERCIAVDAGVMIKTGADVLVSVRRAFAGTDLRQLRVAIEQQFLALDAEERKMRSVMAGMEAGFMQQMARYQHG
ncbi:F0F1 ATP synthase subunit epsilon [Janthinobacterium sp. ROICE36]|uniref:F0F1 ATP synthase subunit epsilon n=1 Tax=Janthinobacterium sp. ROICE36 TaxID=2048670 RepID=UPI000C7E8D9E|nr:F0F1 ATP synthase subunit epsilon [Janthinobacterium sp. ROICE36]PLY39605.1 F0F1 ATP synthase subunit epsilon [Janthinobacterium sp. ROICE36]